jgi:hypothetical protein
MAVGTCTTYGYETPTINMIFNISTLQVGVKPCFISTLSYVLSLAI